MSEPWADDEREYWLEIEDSEFFELGEGWCNECNEYVAINENDECLQCGEDTVIP